MAKPSFITPSRLYLSALFIVATAIMVYFMPRDSVHRYSYEEGRPWTYALLTAPFDITVYRDSATVNAMVDSIEQTLVPIFRTDNMAREQVLAQINANSALPATFKSTLIKYLDQLYSRGIVDHNTAVRIVRGELPEVKFQHGNTFEPRPTKRFLSQRDAYAWLDSVFSRSQADHRAFSEAALSSSLQPNIVEDYEATRAYRESLIQPIVAGIGVIQKGERIISQGDIVTPQLYQVLRSYETILEKHTSGNARHLNIITGQTIIVALVLLLLYGYIAIFYPRCWREPRQMTLLVALLTVFFVISTIMSRSVTLGIYTVPLAIIPLIVNVFYDSRTAFFTFVLSLLLGAMVATFPLEFFFISIVGGVSMLFSLKELSRRSELLRSAIVAFVAYLLAYTGFELMSGGSVSALSWRLIGYFAINAVLISFAYILIFIVEKVFGMVSQVTLVELADINNPVLRQLSTDCPGTFQHSMAVSNLASEAARRVGANVQLVRAGALYHDIGKVNNPAFFTENQHGVNPHDALTPEQSAGIIIRHVTDGVRRAEREKLPQVIKDLILQHHGRGKVKYFYNIYARNNDDASDKETLFTYPGPNPQTLEASILMMSDAVEAASRSLTDHSTPAIRALVDRLIDTQVAEGLHSESPVSFRDIRIIKDVLVSRIASMYHIRVKYPSDVKKPDVKKPSETPSGAN